MKIHFAQALHISLPYYWVGLPLLATATSPQSPQEQPSHQENRDSGPVELAGIHFEGKSCEVQLDSFAVCFSSFLGVVTFLAVLKNRHG
eukprot:CAMPEP_0181514394 /NCGR_PEP_ID=MMETSP1110-20121109/63009_1 /TAXON_ID=174948 /ORGANISM="Symbiodinium sp., Strain CCMP421" /LENGTH=88 /DNA_ID=CAMNT_0023644325 /DNA_START=178 /DNA_END=441 /DNA_ORIENTATION=+